MEIKDQSYENLLFEKNHNVTAEKVPRSTTERVLLFANDNNINSNYSNPIVEFTSQSFSNSGLQYSLGEAYLSVPRVVTVSGLPHDAAPNLDYMLCFKQSDYGFVNFVNIDLNSTSVTNTSVQNINQHIHYKLLGQVGVDDEYMASRFGFARDSQAFNFFTDSVGNQTGEGFCKNVNTHETVEYGRASETLTNEGFNKRASYMSHNNEIGKHNLLTDSIMKTIGSNFIENDISGTTVLDVKNFYVEAIIPLKYLHSIFENCPIMSSGNWKITVGFNTCNFQFIVSESGVMRQTTFNSTGSFEFNPIMIAANKFLMSAAGPVAEDGTSKFEARELVCGSSAIDDGTSRTITVQVGIVSNTLGAKTYTHPKRQCRLFVPAYKLSDHEQSLYVQNPVKSFSYTDLYATSFTAPANSSVQQVLATSLARCSRLIMIPQLKAGANGNSNFSTLASCWSDGNPVPLFMSNIQVYCDGVALYKNNLTNVSELYYLENGKEGLMAGTELGFMKGMSYRQWLNSPYYVFNLESNRDMIYDSIQHNIMISFNNIMSRDIYFLCFIEVDKSLTVNCITGSIVN